MSEDIRAERVTMVFDKRGTTVTALDNVDLVVPAGSKLALSPLSTQRDPTVFPQPGRFRPERWESIHPTPYQYLPFGAGPRMCLGAALATQTLRLMLPMILQRFEPRLTPGAHIDAVVRGITCCPHPGLPVTLHTRHVGRPLTAPQPGPVPAREVVHPGLPPLRRSV